MIPPYSECPNGAACAYFTCAWCELIYGKLEPFTPAEFVVDLNTQGERGAIGTDGISDEGLEGVQEKCPNCGETTYIGYIQPNNSDSGRWVCDICDITWGEEKPEPLTPADAPTPLDSEPPLGNCPNCWMPDDVSFRGFVDGSQAQFYCDNCGYGWIEEAQL